MQLHRLAAIAAAVCALGMTTFAAQATIVNIDAAHDFPTSLSLDAGLYDIQVIGKAQGGLYDAWTYNSASDLFRDAFSIRADGVTLTFDYDNGTARFENSSSPFDALSKGASGPFTIYVGQTDGTVLTRGYAAIPLGLDVATTVSFSVPDYYFGDNSGGVSLSVTAAVPEPETYAMMLAGLGALGFIARRRRAA